MVGLAEHKSNWIVSGEQSRSSCEDLRAGYHELELLPRRCCLFLFRLHLAQYFLNSPNHGNGRACSRRKPEVFTRRRPPCSISWRKFNPVNQNDPTNVPAHAKEKEKKKCPARLTEDAPHPHLHVGAPARPANLHSSGPSRGVGATTRIPWCCTGVLPRSTSSKSTADLESGQHRRFFSRFSGFVCGLKKGLFFLLRLSLSGCSPLYTSPKKTTPRLYGPLDPKPFKTCTCATGIHC